MSTTKCRGAIAPASQAAPSLLALLDSQIVRRQRVSPAGQRQLDFPGVLPQQRMLPDCLARDVTVLALEVALFRILDGSIGQRNSVCRRRRQKLFAERSVHTEHELASHAHAPLL